MNLNSVLPLNLVFPLVTFVSMSVSAAQTFVSVTSSFDSGAPNIVGGVNTGGLVGGVNPTLYTNGSDDLKFTLTIDDSAASGSIYQAVLTLAGLTNGATNEVSVNSLGKLRFFDPGVSTDNSEIQLTVGSITHVSGPVAPTVSFDGFESLTLERWNDVSTDSFTFNGVTYSGDVDGGASGPVSPPLNVGLAPSGSTIVNAGSTEFRLVDVTMQFSVIPEPSSTFLIALAGLGLLRRRR